MKLYVGIVVKEMNIEVIFVIMNIIEFVDEIRFVWKKI